MGGPGTLINNRERTLFVHYEMEPALLQPLVPFELDLYRGKVTLKDGGLLQNAGSWFCDAKFVHANYSPGVHDVWTGRKSA